MTANSEELQRLPLDRQRLEKEILEVTEQERLRIGQDLHDNLGQQLTGVALLTRSLEEALQATSRPEAAKAAKIRALINQAIQYTRDLSCLLTSVKSEGEDLPTALQRLAEQASAVSNVQCKFQQEGELPALDPSVARQLYNIAQEALANALKHAQPKHVVLRLRGLADRLELRIRNDGRPFPPEIRSGAGLGLRIMRYRAGAIGASFSIQPNRKHGALVQCVLPLQQKLLPGLGPAWG